MKAPAMMSPSVVHLHQKKIGQPCDDTATAVAYDLSGWTDGQGSAGTGDTDRRMGWSPGERV